MVYNAILLDLAVFSIPDVHNEFEAHRDFGDQSFPRVAPMVDMIHDMPSLVSLCRFFVFFFPRKVC
jgi:hypothetical protein